MSAIALTRQQSRSVDAIAIERYGMSGLVLMENAGRGVVDVLLDVDPQLVNQDESTIAILCGKGNNAGDGFVIARHLELRGARAKVILLASPQELRGDAQTNYEILCHTGVPIVDLSAAEDLAGSLSAESAESRWLVDAMLGTGAQGEPREPFATAIEWMNSQDGCRLAVDVPSGLDCDSGRPAHSTLRADHTCTFVATKQGFSVASASAYLGKLHVVSIGIPSKFLAEVIDSDNL